MREMPNTGPTSFQTTNWAIVLSSSADPAVTAALLNAYHGPIWTFIRRSGHTADAADDLAQEFIARVVLERGLIARAEPSRGRFRTFVKTALRNFLVDQYRRGKTSAGLSRHVEPEVAEQALHDAFDREWAATVLKRALEHVEHECLRARQDLHWKAFQLAVLNPALRQAPSPGLANLAADLGVEDAAQVSSMIQTIRRKFKRLLRTAVEETVDDPTEVDSELSDLRRILGT
ncbi:MAG: sigma-70 family RNA polymerase sigma factor [Phycisphaerales bacterium]|nr:sigma-70 family RNA polymerase sigma factor [Phycisphaerales bacterium]